jgi:putative ABC transport system permease protein
MALVGLLVLLVACVNYVNLTTSRASNRAVEVGLRKVIGANRGRLVGQFLGESALLTTLSFLFSLALVQTALPALNVVMRKGLSLNLKHDAGLVLIFFAASLGIGLLSGIYPAFVLSSFRPAAVIRGEITRGRKGSLLRRSLVVFQFAVTTGLVVVILIVLAQIRFLRTMDLGYDRSDVVAVPAPNRTGDDVLKRRLESLPAVVSVGRIDALPGPNFWRFELIREGHDRSENFTASRFAVDEDTFRTLEITVRRGRGFSRNFPADAQDGIVVNETLVRKFGFEDPVGTVLRYYDESNNNSITARTIVGVIRDFHYLTARQASEPMIFLLDPRGGYLLLVRVAPGEMARTLPILEKEFKAVHPDRTFSCEFLDETFNTQFSGDKDFMRNIGLFAGLAIFIAALGLVGLAAFSIERRRKEIAIRKVLGSGERKVYGLLLADFAAWVLVANIIAWPAAYFAAKSWLADFTYRVPFQIWTFGLASLATLLVALLTVSVQSLRAIRANPANALRDVG